MEISVPQLSLVLLAGPSGSGKTTFGRTHFGPHEVVSSDACRALVSGDETALDATDDAFDLLYHLVGIRLRRGLLTVVDATNVRAEDRCGLVALAREHHALPTIIVLLPELEVCLGRTAARDDRNFGPGVVRKQYHTLRKGLRGLKREGFRKTHVLDSEAAIAAVAGIERERLYNDRRDESGPFDIIGDVHGCLPELETLLGELGYQIDDATGVYAHPGGRRLVFVGDLVDRGPDPVGVLRLVMAAVEAGTAYCVVGNHDARLHKHLAGRKVQLTHGLFDTAQAMAAESDAFRAEVRDFLYGLISHYVFDDGRLVVAHAGLPEAMQGRGSRAMRQFAMYGETTGEIDAFGLPVRYPWARDYRGEARVVYGHTPVPEPQWLNRTIDIDTGCCFGGSLTALRYPELETVAVPAERTYAEPVRPIVPPTEQTQSRDAEDDLLDVADFTGKRRIDTAWAGRITVSAEKAASALEVMSRFAIDPRWLVYLPPTMSPCGTSELTDFLEHPNQAFSYYRRRSVERVVCEEKHMGSRAVVVLCRRPAVARERFGVEEEGWGAVYTRTGRAFFPEASTATQWGRGPGGEQALLERLAGAAENAGVWEGLATDWLVLDCEVMPWSAKAQSLIESQYAAVGASAKTSLAAVANALERARGRELAGVGELRARVAAKQTAIDRYAEAYRPYCWPVNSLDDYAVAPFHVLASEGATHFERPHDWHLGLIDRLCEADPGIFRRTGRQYVDLRDEASVGAGTDWWLGLTGAGGEGMVVKPTGFAVRHEGKLLQPGVKCRGRDYLRLIYGPTYTLELDRLRDRKLSTKRGLAIREFALGAEALRRFVAQEPLRRVHACVFGVLALESEGVDARL